MDSRMWNDALLMALPRIQAEGMRQGDAPVGGLSDLCMDLTANLLIREAGKTMSHYWMPAALATEWFLQKDIQMVFAHWALAALHGHLFMAIAQTTLDLAGIFYQQGVLHMLHDGWAGTLQEHLLNFANKLGQLLAISPCRVTKVQCYSQMCSQNLRHGGHPSSR